MILAAATDLETAYQEILGSLLSEGATVPSRLGDTLDIGPAALCLAPGSVPLLANHSRAINPALAIVEACWILSGSDELEPLARITSNFNAFSDDGTTLAGAYGNRLRHRFGFDQIEAAARQLRNDPASRRSFAMIATPEDTVSSSRDVPCNIALIFRIVDGALTMTVVNRSNDAIFGLPYDIFSLSLVHHAVAARAGFPTGSHLHIANSMHLYLTNVETARRAQASFPVVKTPIGEAAAEFMATLVDDADAIGNVDLPRIRDHRIRTVLQASLSDRDARGDLSGLPDNDWLGLLAHSFLTRRRTSGVASLPADVS